MGDWMLQEQTYQQTIEDEMARCMADLELEEMTLEALARCRAAGGRDEDLALLAASCGLSAEWQRYPK